MRTTYEHEVGPRWGEWPEGHLARARGARDAGELALVNGEAWLRIRSSEGDIEVYRFTVQRLPDEGQAGGER